MELNDLITSTCVGLIAIVSFFVRRLIHTVEILKEERMEKRLSEQRMNEIEKHLYRNEEIMYKKFTSVHAREEKQREINEEMKLIITRMDGKLDQLLKNSNNHENN